MADAAAPEEGKDGKKGKRGQALHLGLTVKQARRRTATAFCSLPPPARRLLRRPAGGRLPFALCACATWLVPL